MDITIRPEQPGDYRAVEELTREAFWGLHQPACDEHLLVHNMRTVPAFVPELDFVAEAGGRLAGNIMFTKAQVVSGDGTAYEVLVLGPLSVLPEYQKRGVGRALVRHAAGEARRLGHRAIFLFGHPDYYPRLGFVPAGTFGITTAEGANFDAFMVLPLRGHALDGVAGRLLYDPVFEVDAGEAAEFDRGFPAKEPRELAPVSVLLERLAAPARRAVEAQEITHLVDITRFSGDEVAAWHGIGKSAMRTIDEVLLEYGYPKKVWPSLR